MIGRLAWLVLCLVVAVVATFAQIDRSARFAPQLASLVPRALSGFAAEQRAAAALGGDPEVAVAEARELVMRRPAAAEHLAVLALASARAGDEPLALAALQAASRRGWRVPMVQQASAETAFSQARYDAAAQRIAALFATGDARDEALDLARRLLAEPEGRTAFAALLASRGHWQAGTLEPLSRAVDPGDFSLTAEKAGLACSRTAPIADRFESDGSSEAAEMLRRSCAD